MTRISICRVWVLYSLFGNLACILLASPTSCISDWRFELLYIIFFSDVFKLCLFVILICFRIFLPSPSMGHFNRPWHDVSIRPSDVSFMWAHWLPDSRVCWWFVRHSGICLVLVCFWRISPLRHFWYFVGSWGEHELFANASITSLLVFEVSAVH